MVGGGGVGRKCTQLELNKNKIKTMSEMFLGCQHIGVEVTNAEFLSAMHGAVALANSAGHLCR